MDCSRSIPRASTAVPGAPGLWRTGAPVAREQWRTSGPHRTAGGESDCGFGISDFGFNGGRQSSFRALRPDFCFLFCLCGSAFHVPSSALRSPVAGNRKTEIGIVSPELRKKGTANGLPKRGAPSGSTLLTALSLSKGGSRRAEKRNRYGVPRIHLLSQAN